MTTTIFAALATLSLAATARAGADKAPPKASPDVVAPNCANCKLPTPFPFSLPSGGQKKLAAAEPQKPVLVAPNGCLGGCWMPALPFPFSLPSGGQKKLAAAEPQKPVLVAPMCGGSCTMPRLPIPWMPSGTGSKLV